ncbi:DUF4132 domain-containing protein [Actinospica robiniae]|uniref:DUF4132 domain-containing protein n=1 Tax=Actinospica robiniae TaxID=304901 RepID=UPI0012F7A320|nr:DUF4132 domain-containing protein [Actinospica robiniae]
MSTAVSGAEEELVIPAEWMRVLHPRRGGSQASAIELPAHTGATGPLEELHAQVAAASTELIENSRTAPELTEAFKAQLAGKTSPAGAAAAALAAKTISGTDLRAHLDAWITAHGLPFAVEATLAAGRIELTSPYYRSEPRLAVSSYAGLRGMQLELFRCLRGYLAAASEPAYAQAVEVLAAHRSELRDRVLAAYLAPTEAAWVAQACAEGGKIRTQVEQWRPLVVLLQCSVGGVEEWQALRKRKVLQMGHVDLGLLATLAISLGPAAVELFPPVLDNRWADAAVRRAALDVLARIPGDEAFAVMTQRLTMKHVSTAAAQAAERFPRRATRLLAGAACAAEAAENALLARNLLVGHLARHADLVPSVRPTLTEAERALVDELRALAAGRPAAPVETLPELLVNPPWTRKRPRPRPARGSAAGPVEPAPDALQAPEICRIDWLPGERETFDHGRPKTFESDWEPILKEIEARGLTRWDHDARGALLHAPEAEARRALSFLRSGFGQSDQVYAFGPLLVRFGTDAIEPILYQGSDRSLVHRGAVLQPIVELRVARLMAQWLQRLDGGRPPARAWLARHGADAAVLLIPDALGTDKQLRPLAEDALRYLAEPKVGVEVASIAEREYGASAAVEVKSVVEADPLELIPARAPKLADWLSEAHLPQILLRGRKEALPEESVRHVLTMLMLSRPGEPYAGLETVVELADPVSLCGFGRALFAAWRARDYVPKESWILYAQGFLGDASTVRHLVSLISGWPRENGNHRATLGLEVLDDFGTDQAMLHLYRISRTTTGRSLRERAGEKVGHLAAARGMTPAQFVDRLIPDLGLDAQQGTWLDYGPRRFRVELDELGGYSLADEQGATYATLPQPKPGQDDPELAETARERLSSLIDDAKLVRTHAAERLESAMSMSRAFSTSELRTLLTHPLVGTMARGLVWLSEDSGPGTAFRIAEDGAFADVEDRTYELPQQATVRIAHAARLGADLGAWAELFADYEIIQPFPQLGRPVYGLVGAERTGAPFTRYQEALVLGERMRELLERGWQRERSYGYGPRECLLRPTPDGRWLALALKPDFQYTAGPEARSRVDSVSILEAPHVDGSGRSLPPSPLHDLDPITVSELIGDLNRLVDGEP